MQRGARPSTPRRPQTRTRWRHDDNPARLRALPGLHRGGVRASAELLYTPARSPSEQARPQRFLLIQFRESTPRHLPRPRRRRLDRHAGSDRARLLSWNRHSSVASLAERIEALGGSVQVDVSLRFDGGVDEGARLDRAPVETKRRRASTSPQLLTARRQEGMSERRGRRDTNAGANPSVVREMPHLDSIASVSIS